MSAFQKRGAADKTVAFPPPLVGHLSITSCKLNMRIMYLVYTSLVPFIVFLCLGFFFLVCLVWFLLCGIFETRSQVTLVSLELNI